MILFLTVNQREPGYFTSESDILLLYGFLLGILGVL